MNGHVHYFTIFTKEFENIANFGLKTFKQFNNVLLNVYVLDNSDPVLDYENINIIRYAPKLKLDEFNDKYISKKAINCAIQSLDIIKQDFEIFVRIDLDAIFFCNIEELVEYSVIHKIGFLGAKDYWSENKEYFHKPYYLNCGIAVFNKKYFNLKTDFQMFYNPEIHFCPEQDYLNTIENKKPYPGSICLSALYLSNLDSLDNLKIIHLNGFFTKPFKKIPIFSELLFVFIDLICFLGKNSVFENIFEENKKFLNSEFKKLQINKKVKLLKAKRGQNWKKLFVSGSVIETI